MDEAAFERTAQIAKQFDVIKADASSDAYRTDLAEAAVERARGRGRRRERRRLGEGDRRGHRGRRTRRSDERPRREIRMSVLIKGGRVITAADDYVADILVEDERISLIGESLDVAADTRDRRVRQVRAAGRGRPAHAPRHAVRRHGHDRRRRVGPAGGGARRHDDCHVDFCIQAPGTSFARRARRLEVEGRRQAGDRHGLPHRGHRPEGGRLARGARVAARPGRSPRTSSSWPTRAR